MEQGKTEQSIIQQCLREGLPLPKRIKNAPSLFMGLELFYGAFIDLNTDRQSGMGLAPIPWTAIDRYCVANEFFSCLREDMFHHIREMDKEFMEYHNKKSKSKSKSKSKIGDTDGGVGRSKPNNAGFRRSRRG